MRKADELAKEGAMLDGGFMAQARGSTILQEREREKKCTQPCNMQPVFTVWWKNGKIAKNLSRSQKRSGRKRSIRWCAAANKYRCMRCGRSRKYMKMQ